MSEKTINSEQEVEKSLSAKLKGVNLVDSLFAFVGALIGIGIITYLAYQSENFALIAPPFGAAAVLFFAAPGAPLVKPKNAFFGHLLSALVGTTVYYFLGLSWFSIALSVSLAIGLMVLTGTTHPPGGATAFLAVMAEKNFLFLVNPILIGTIILFIVSVATNYFHPDKSYPVKE
ncbi:CBS-domain-containing membrane protein [Halobacteroides halobius DSM 5150]|uniref:CBS-domain-containing membrane protein n=1 Tax=Halobacteroides halobius (strain ATCC 35273 / DSM 5150 / MD-1) TaxID=748449 RepID=L0KAR3_HALHC|nr:HPP family protein [Halobacteroides halobius]AGB41183.1 CBS-domain-containing membrane protein [Halobacteroides halobius DSM 5150]